MFKAKRIGIEKYHEEQLAKKKILDKLLNEYDDGHRDVFFCLAVNLLELDDLNAVLNNADWASKDMSLNEKSDYMKRLLLKCGQKRNIELKLRNDGYYG